MAAIRPDYYGERPNTFTQIVDAFERKDIRRASFKSDDICLSIDDAIAVHRALHDAKEKLAAEREAGTGEYHGGRHIKTVMDQLDHAIAIFDRQVAK